MVYRAPIIIAVIKDAFFENQQGIGSVNRSRLRSSRSDCPDELELPASMVAFAAAAVCQSGDLSRY